MDAIRDEDQYVTAKRKNLLRLIDSAAGYMQALVLQLRGCNGISSDDQPVPAIDQRWVSIAQTDLQKGFMAMRRAVMTDDTNRF